MILCRWSWRTRRLFPVSKTSLSPLCRHDRITGISVTPYVTVCDKGRPEILSEQGLQTRSLMNLSFRGLKRLSLPSRSHRPKGGIISEVTDDMTVQFSLLQSGPSSPASIIHFVVP